MNSKLMNFSIFQISKEEQKNIKGASSGIKMSITINADACSCGTNNPENWEYGQTSSYIHFLPCQGGDQPYIVIDTVN